MALLEIESFESLAFTTNGKWTGSGFEVRSLSAAKTGSYGIDAGGNASIFTWGGNKATIICGFHFKMIGSRAESICRLMDGTSVQCTVGVNVATGAIQAWRADELGGGVLLGTSASAGLIVANNWHFVEVKATISDTVGAIEIRVDGVTALTLSGVDTKATANAYVNKITIGRAGGGVGKYFDNFYCCDDAGTLNNTFLGEGEVLFKPVNGAGSSTQWTPSAGSNYQNVDEPDAHDSDTTYNSSTTAGQKDMFTVADIPVTGGSVAGVKVTTVARKDDVGVRQLATVVNFNSSESQRATNTLSTSYAGYAEIFETDPVDASALTEAKVNGMQIGYTMVA